MRLGLYATQDDATEQARLLLATGVATRVETVKRVDGRVEVVAVRSQCARFGARSTADLSQRLMRTDDASAAALERARVAVGTPLERGCFALPFTPAQAAATTTPHG